MSARFAGGMLAIAFASAGLVACGDADDADSGDPARNVATAASAGGESVKVMVVGPFSAKDVVPFGNLPAVAEATAEAIDAGEDPAQRPVELVVCDDAGDQSKNVTCARDAIEQEVDAVVTASVSAAAGVKVLGQARIPVISVVGFLPEELGGENVFNIAGGGPGLSGAAAGVLVEGASPSRIDIVAQDDAQSRAGVRGAEDVLASHGTSAARTTYVDPAATDLAPAASASTQGGIDGVVALPQYNVLQAYMKAIGQAGVEGVTFATSDLNLPPAVIGSLGEAAEGMYIGALFKPLTDARDPAVARFVEDLTRAASPIDPRRELLPWAAEGVYVGIRVASHAASLVDGEPTAEAVLEALPRVEDYRTGLVAPLSFATPSTAFEGVTRIFNTKMLVGRVQRGQVVVDDPDAWVDYVGDQG